MKWLRVREFPEYLGWQVAYVCLSPVWENTPILLRQPGRESSVSEVCCWFTDPYLFPLVCLSSSARFSFPSLLCVNLYMRPVYASHLQPRVILQLWPQGPLRGHWAWGPAPDVTCFDPWCWGHGVGSALLCQTKILGCPALSAANMVPTQITLRGTAPQIAGAPPTPLRPNTHPKNSL